MTKNNHIRHYGRARAALGMSIIELMLTISIVAVLAGLAVPSFTNVIQNSRVRSQASDLMANLAIARAEAAKRGMRVTMCPSTTYNSATPACNTGTLGTAWGQGYIVFADVNADGAFNAGSDVLIMVSEALSGNNTLTSANFTNNPVNTLQFRPSGSTNLPANGCTLCTPTGGPGGTFKLCDSRTGNFGRLITVAVTGRAISASTSCP
jgi:type IV fimbrial biogenesis protein FimT